MTSKSRIITDGFHNRNVSKVADFFPVYAIELLQISDVFEIADIRYGICKNIFWNISIISIKKNEKCQRIK